MGQPTWYKPTDYRSGIGYDVHPLVKGRKLVLGAAGQGDIGEHFPDTDLRYKGASSLRLLGLVRKVIEKAGLKVANVDCVLLAEEPRISPYKSKMCQNIAKALNVDVDRVNVKATTNEGLGLIGRKEGLAAYATALLRSVKH